jgi:predicted nucleic acid-binding protein
MESKNIIVDSSVWISLFNHEDSNHKKAISFEEILLKEQIMPDLVFYESLTILKNKIKNNELLKEFNIFATDSLNVTIKLFYENNRDVLNLFIREYKDGLSYVDVLLLYLSNDYHILTFDEKLKKRIKECGGKLVN